MIYLETYVEVRKIRSDTRTRVHLTLRGADSGPAGMDILGYHSPEIERDARQCGRTRTLS